MQRPGRESPAPCSGAAARAHLGASAGVHDRSLPVNSTLRLSNPSPLHSYTNASHHAPFHFQMLFALLILFMVERGVGVKSQSPTVAPTKQKNTGKGNGKNSLAPTAAPSAAPSVAPSEAPSVAPTNAPTQTPTTAIPTHAPTSAPTVPPSAPTRAPTVPGQTYVPSTAPTTSLPTVAPSSAPSHVPTTAPSAAPSSAPTVGCVEKDDDVCLQISPQWDATYDCASSTVWCTTWSKDMQRCCPDSCGTGALNEAECLLLPDQGTCTYPNGAFTPHTV